MKNILHQIAEKLVENGKGILAADESTATITKRFDQINLQSTPENRRLQRDALSNNGRNGKLYIWCHFV